MRFKAPPLVGRAMAEHLSAPKAAFWDVSEKQTRVPRASPTRCPLPRFPSGLGGCSGETTELTSLILAEDRSYRPVLPPQVREFPRSATEPVSHQEPHARGTHGLPGNAPAEPLPGPDLGPEPPAPRPGPCAGGPARGGP